MEVGEDDAISRGAFGERNKVSIRAIAEEEEEEAQLYMVPSR